MRLVTLTTKFGEKNPIFSHIFVLLFFVTDRKRPILCSTIIVWSQTFMFFVTVKSGTKIQHVIFTEIDYKWQPAL